MVYSGSILYRKVLSPFYDQLVTLIPAAIHPNHLTIMGGISALCACFAAFNDYRWASCFLFSAYHMLDNMDGKHARRTKQSSEIGAILDHFVDGTCGIWSGAVGLMYGIGVEQDIITIGVFLFTTLFYIVHTVHAFSGFFEIGGDYLSIDEVFLFISLSYALWALHLTHFPILSNYVFHQFLLVGIVMMCAFWIYAHGHKIKLDRMKSKPFVLLPGVIYFAIMLSGGLQKCLDMGFHGTGAVIAAFALPYAVILWESKDKH